VLWQGLVGYGTCNYGPPQRFSVIVEFRPSLNGLPTAYTFSRLANGSVISEKWTLTMNFIHVDDIVRLDNSSLEMRQTIDEFSMAHYVRDIATNDDELRWTHGKGLTCSDLKVATFEDKEDDDSVTSRSPILRTLSAKNQVKALTIRLRNPQIFAFPTEAHPDFPADKPIFPDLEHFERCEKDEEMLSETYGRTGFWWGVLTTLIVLALALLLLWLIRKLCFSHPLYDNLNYTGIVQEKKAGRYPFLRTNDRTLTRTNVNTTTRTNVNTPRGGTEVRTTDVRTTRPST
jgi:hypothetical protein